jgi:hypothetical protein
MSEFIDPTNNDFYGFTFKSVKNEQGHVVHGGTSRIGDALIWSSIPEMLFKQQGKKIVDMDNHWQFDNNPYVVRNVSVKNIIPVQALADKSTFHYNLRNQHSFTSIVDRMCAYFGLECTIRHPKLYKYEDSKRNPLKVILTTQGNNQGLMMGETSPRIIPDYVIEQIKENYSGFEIVQIGSKTDKRAEGTIDKRGLTIWDSVKEISEAMYYIGVNTGVMHIASAFPHITKKIVLAEYNKNSLQYYIPLSANNHHSSYLYFAEQFFNVYNEDIGVTTTYKNI